jgi:predicted XRE-type DNA-binding protein
MGAQTSSSNANIQQNCFGNHPYCKKTRNKKLENDLMKTLVQCIQQDSMKQQAQSPVLEMQKHSQNS